MTHLYTCLLKSSMSSNNNRIKDNKSSSIAIFEKDRHTEREKKCFECMLEKREKKNTKLDAQRQLALQKACALSMCTLEQKRKKIFTERARCSRKRLSLGGSSIDIYKNRLERARDVLEKRLSLGGSFFRKKRYL